MLINKKEVDIALNNKDYTKFKQLFQNASTKSILEAVNERHRFNYLIKKQDLKFVNNLFNFIDNSIDSEKYKNENLVEIVRTISTADNFKFQSTFKSINTSKKKNKNFLKNIYHEKENEVQKFKYQVLSRILLDKKDANIDFVSQAFSIVKQHNLINKYSIRRFGDLALNSDFEPITDYFIKTNILSNKELRKEYLAYVFQKTTDINRLDYLLGKFENDIREIFFEKIDNNDFWYDFKVPSQNDNRYYFGTLSDTLRPNSNNTAKLIWLETHHMGFSNTEIPFYVNFLKNFEFKNLEIFLNNVDKDKYLTMFSKSVEQFEALPEKFRTGKYWERMSQPTEDQNIKLLKELNYKVPLSESDFYSDLKMLTLKVNLEHSLKVNDASKKSKKI